MADKISSSEVSAERTVGRINTGPGGMAGAENSPLSPPIDPNLVDESTLFTSHEQAEAGLALPSSSDSNATDSAALNGGNAAPPSVSGSVSGSVSPSVSVSAPPSVDRVARPASGTDSSAANAAVASTSDARSSQDTDLDGDAGPEALDLETSIDTTTDEANAAEARHAADLDGDDSDADGSDDADSDAADSDDSDEGADERAGGRAEGKGGAARESAAEGKAGDKGKGKKAAKASAGPARAASSATPSGKAGAGGLSSATLASAAARGAVSGRGSQAALSVPPSGPRDEQFDSAITNERMLWSPRSKAGASAGVTTTALPASGKSVRRLATLTPGTIIGKRFELLELRGSGSLGTVWKAQDQKSSRLVVLKLFELGPEDKPERVERFLHSAKVTASLRHPNVVRVLETSLKDGDLLYYSMEFLGGGNIRNAMMGGRVNREQIVSAILDVCEALIFAHKSGVIHKDIKPSNIVMRTDGSFVLTDFDLAWIEESGSAHAGADGGAVYMAPEVVERKRSVDQVSDVYSIGMTALFLLNGLELVKGPPSDEAGIRLLEAQKSVLSRAVDVDRGKRFPTLKEFRDALRDANGDKPDDRPEAEPEEDSDADEKPSAQAKGPDKTAKVGKATVARPTQAGKGDGKADKNRGAEAAPARSTQPGTAHASQPETHGTPIQKSGPHAPIKLIFPQEQKREGDVHLPTRGTGQAEGAKETRRQDPPEMLRSGSSSPAKRPKAPSWLAKNVNKVVMWTAIVALNATAVWYLVLQTPTAIRPDLPWVRIDGATFIMGSTEADDETPSSAIRISTFYMTQTEITVAQYQACISAGGCSLPDNSQAGCNYGKAGREKYPINCLDHGQAKDFAEWAGGRLPTEAEWEFAARSRGQLQSYPWGNQKPTCARVNFKDGADAMPGCGNNSTAPVCSKEGGETREGLCDMAGNVWEWVADFYSDDAYASYAKEDPTGPLLGLKRSLRGGSYQDDAWGIRSANRFFQSGSKRFPTVGFRIVTRQPPTVGP